MINDYDRVPVPISVRRPDGRYTYVNRAWCDLFSLESASALERTDSELNLDPLALPLGQIPAVADELAYRDVYVTTRHNGRVLLELIETRMGEAGGDILCVHQDVTGLGWRIEDLSRAHAEAERRGRQQLQHLVELSRDLCEPLNVMDTYCKKLQESDLEPGQAEWVNLLRSNIALLLRQIGRVVDLSISGMDEPMVEERALRIDRIVSELVTHYRRSTRDVRVQTHVDAMALKPLFGDETKLRQLLINMFDAALSSRPGSTVHLRVEAGAVREGMMDICLRLTSSDLASIHSGVETIDPRSLPGMRSSLTLQIIRGLTSLLGGRFEVDLQPQGNATLRVYLRLRHHGA